MRVIDSQIMKCCFLGETSIHFYSLHASNCGFEKCSWTSVEHVTLAHDSLGTYFSNKQLILLSNVFVSLMYNF